MSSLTRDTGNTPKFMLCRKLQQLCKLLEKNPQKISYRTIHSETHIFATVGTLPKHKKNVLGFF